MKFHPTEDNAVVRLDAQLGEEGPQLGTVLALGPGYHADDGTLVHPEFICPGVQEGSSVLLSSWQGECFDWEGQRLVVLPVRNLLARLEKESVVHA